MLRPRSMPSRRRSPGGCCARRCRRTGWVFRSAPGNPAHSRSLRQSRAPEIRRAAGQAPADPERSHLRPIRQRSRPEHPGMDEHPVRPARDGDRMRPRLGRGNAGSARVHEPGQRDEAEAAEEAMRSVSRQRSDVQPGHVVRSGYAVRSFTAPSTMTMMAIRVPSMA
jgi:hypothetical protein